jgi:hypothetical protein
MMDARLRRAEGPNGPFARAKTRPASRAAVASYPLGEFRDNFQGTAEIAARRTHHKNKNITTSAATETFENVFLRINVERGIAFGMQRAEADELTPGPAQPRKLADNRGYVNTRFQFAGIEWYGNRDHKVTKVPP